MKAYALTTVDNPYHPIDEFEQWYAFDIFHHHNTCGVLANVLQETIPCYKTGRDVLLSHVEDQRNINFVIDEIVRLDDTGLYKRVVLED